MNEIERLKDLLSEAYADADEVLRPRVADLEQQLAESQAREKVLIEQRNAWKEIAEYQYGKWRLLQGGEADYPVTGALDVWACGRYPILKEEVYTDYTALKAVLAKERERCAKVCLNNSVDGYGYLPLVAEAIRALGDE